jgi:hypothetical protein
MILPYELSSTMEMNNFGICSLGGTEELDRGGGGWHYHVDYSTC